MIGNYPARPCRKQAFCPGFCTEPHAVSRGEELLVGKAHVYRTFIDRANPTLTDSLAVLIQNEESTLLGVVRSQRVSVQRCPRIASMDCAAVESARHQITGWVPRSGSVWIPFG